MRARMGIKRWLRSCSCTPFIIGAVIGAVFAATAGFAPASNASELSKKPPGHPITVELAARQFLGDDAPFALARTAYGNAFASWEAAKQPFAATTDFVGPFVKACTTFSHKLDSQRWPPRARSDVRVFARSLSFIENDVNALPSLTTAAGARALATRFARDSATSLADSNLLRGVLNVAPVSS